MRENDGFKTFFIRGIFIIIIAVVCLFIGAAIIVGVLSVVNNITPPELLRGYFEDQDQPTSGPGDLEEETLAEGQETDESEKTGEKETGAFSLEEFDNAVNEVAEEINSSVVNVMVTIKQYDIFGQEYLAEGLGSGVIYDDEGYIITNNHVAGEAEDILVTLYDGSEYPAELKGADENTDIAVIKIEADDLNAASFASIDTVKVGDFVIAVGSPFGLQQTVTTGVISAKGRDITVSPETLPMVNLVQTDAAINSGNSGGPLVNSAGQVIGINTIMLSPSGGSAGIGFAIPSDTVLNMAEQIIKFGRVKIPYIGVEMGENNTDIVGVYINDVPEGYPASEAGIRDGDIITKFDGVEVKTSYELFAQILKHNVGDEVGVEIYRDGDYFTLTLKLVENPVTQESS
jgi:S1-C subfamily serine protease